MVSIGIYSRQFLFFVGLTALLIGMTVVIRSQTSEAAGRPIAIPTTTQTMAVDLYLEDTGKVRLDNYQVPGTVSFLKDYDELRYLLVDQADAYLDRLQVTVHFPRSIQSDAVRASAIVVHDTSTTWEVTTSENSVVYEVKNLGPTATLTLVTQFPKDIVLPSLSQRIFGTITSLPQIIWLTLALILPLLALIILAIVLAPQLRQRMARLGSEAQPTPPENLLPAVVTALVEGHVSARAIAATLLDLARRNYIEIGSHDGTYTFTKKRRLLESQTTGNDLASFERVLLSKIFAEAPQASEEDIRVRIGHRLFSQKIASVYLAIYEEVTRLGYFVENPSVVSGSYRLAGLGIFFVGILGFVLGAVFFANPPTPLLFWAGTILASLVVIAIAPRMPAHTTLGIHKRREWLRFKNFLKDSAPIDYRGQTQQEFFTYLPYAVALGAEADWSSRFMASPFQLPQWYVPAANVARWEDFFQDMFPIVGFLAHELAAVKEPTLS